MKNKFDTSNIKVINAFGEALGRYGLRLDSANKVIVRVVKDSSKTKIVLPQSAKLSLCYGAEIEQRNCVGSNCFYRLSICSYDAGIVTDDVLYDVVLVDSVGKFLSVASGELIPKNTRISSQEILQAGINLNYSFSYNKVVFYVHGTYKNASDEVKVRIIDDVYEYFVKEKYSTTLTRSAKDDVVKYIKLNR